MSRAQLRMSGLSADMIDRRVASGRFRVLYRGIYQVGPVAGLWAREFAAALACGANAVVSHWSAGVMWGILTPLVNSVLIEITVPGTIRRRPSGIRAHRARTLLPGEVVCLAGVPLTSAGRVLLDLAPAVKAPELERALAHAERLGLITPPGMIALLDAHEGQRGTRALRALLSSDVPPAFERSELETLMRALIRRAGLPRALINTKLHGYEVDFLWPAAKLVVEVDGESWHSSSQAFLRDRRRDAALRARGYSVVRFTWVDIVKEPEATAILLARILGQAGL